jgi:putative transposase
MRDFKKLTNNKIVEEIGNINESRKEWLLMAFAKAGKDLKRITGNKLWQDGNHPILLDSAEKMRQKVDYIHYNPVSEVIVDEPEYYWFSSARDYCGKKGLLDINHLY